MPKSSATNAAKLLAAGLVLAAASVSSTLAGAGVDANGQPVKTFVKDIIRTGTWTMPDGVTFDVTTDLMDKWVGNFAAMSAAGVKVPAPDGHTFDAGKNMGWVTGMFRDGDVLKANIQLIGEDAIKLASRSEVSIYAVPKFTDGAGKQYDNAILHVALTPVPVIPGQGPFVPIAASRGGTQQIPVLRLAENTMNPLQQIAQALGITTDGMDDAAILAAVLAKIQASAGVAAAHKADKDALTLARTQIQTLEAARGKPIEVDPDTIMASVDSVTLQLDSLVEKRCITKAVRDELAPVLLGTAEARPALCLSHKAAAAAGFAGPIAKLVIAALLKNDGKALALASGEKTGRQSVALSRGSTDDANDPSKPDPDVDKLARQIYGKPALVK